MQELSSLKSSASEHDIILELKDFYDKFLIELVDLAKYYGYKSALEIFGIVNLISDIFDENQREICRNISIMMLGYPDSEKRDILGVQTLLGCGVCRHKSALLSDLYNKMGKESLILGGRSDNILNFYYGNSVNDKLFVSEILEKISRGATIEDFEEQLKSRSISYQIKKVDDGYYFRVSPENAHAIVLVGDNKRYYIDPMNRSFLFSINGNENALKNSEGEAFFFNKKDYMFYGKITCQLEPDFTEKYEKILRCESSKEKETKKEFSIIESSIINNPHLLEFIREQKSQIQGCKSLLLKRK